MNDKDFLMIFKKYEEQLLAMNTSGIFKLQNGKAILNYNPQGQLGSIEVQLKTYKRKKQI